MKNTDLVTVPSFTFNQGNIGDSEWEMPINVEFYNGSITLRQDGGYEEQEFINISAKHIDALFKAIKKHTPQAQAYLEGIQR